AGLDPFYLEFLRRLGGNRRQYGHVLGTLAVAREALTEAQLAGFVNAAASGVRKVLKQLGQLVPADESIPASERTYKIYHQSFAEFLLHRDRAEDYWCEAKEQHRRIVGHYRKRCRGNWVKLAREPYARQHLATHLVGAGRPEELDALISKPWMEAKLKETGSHRAFAEDVRLALEAARAEEPPDLPRLVRHSLIYSTLSELATTIPV